MPSSPRSNGSSNGLGTNTKQLAERRGRFTVLQSLAKETFEETFESRSPSPKRRVQLISRTPPHGVDRARAEPPAMDGVTGRPAMGGVTGLRPDAAQILGSQSRCLQGRAQVNCKQVGEQLEHSDALNHSVKSQTGHRQSCGRFTAVTVVMQLVDTKPANNTGPILGVINVDVSAQPLAEAPTMPGSSSWTPAMNPGLQPDHQYSIQKQLVIWQETKGLVNKGSEPVSMLERLVVHKPSLL